MRLVSIGHIRYALLSSMSHLITHTSVIIVHFIPYTAKAADAQKREELKALHAKRQQQLEDAKEVLECISNGGGGDCWPRLIAQLLYGSERSHSQIRKDLVAIIKKYPLYFKHFMQDGMPLEEYLDKVSKDNEWCDEAVIAATAILVNRPVMIYCDSLNFNVPLTYYPFGDADADSLFGDQVKYISRLCSQKFSLMMDPSPCCLRRAMMKVTHWYLTVLHLKDLPHPA